MNRWLARAALLVLLILSGCGARADAASGGVPPLVTLTPVHIGVGDEDAGEVSEPKGAISEANQAKITPSGGIQLRLEPVLPTSFTNAVAHYVRFNAVTENAEKLVMRLYSPKGKLTPFRTKQLVTFNRKPVNAVTLTLDEKDHGIADLNVMFNSGLAEGSWIIRVTAEAQGLETVQEEIQVQIRKPDPLVMSDLETARKMVKGYQSSMPLNVETGKIRYVSQEIRDPNFVKEYWFSKGHDLRKIAKGKCTRAVFSMALSYLGIDCTPVGMSDMLKAEMIFYTYDDVCEWLGGIKRHEGDLETLWAAYEAGKASPVLLHFKYSYEGYDGMHALLLIARDSKVPELFYALAPGQKTNTSGHPGGMKDDPIIPILIDRGEEGFWIQSPLLKKYNKGRIDAIWNWSSN